MRNKIILFLITLSFWLCNSTTSFGNDPFRFDVTEIEVLNEGNLIIGKKKGSVFTQNGIEVNADNFKYDKLTNILTASGDVVLEDNISKIKIFTNEIFYERNKEKIFTVSNSKVVSKVKGKEIEITADNVEYNKLSNIFYARENVIIEDKLAKIKILTDKAVYKKNSETINTSGRSKAFNESIIIYGNMFQFDRSKNVISAEGEVIIDDTLKNIKIFSDSAYFFKNENIFKTKNNSKAIDGSVTIEAQDFTYRRNKEILNAKGEVIIDDTLKNIKIFSDNAYFYKNENIFKTKNNSKAVDGSVTIEAQDFTYRKNKEILNAKNKVKIRDTYKNYTVLGKNITYFKSEDKIFSKGLTDINLNSEYKFISEDVTILRSKN